MPQTARKRETQSPVAPRATEDQANQIIGLLNRIAQQNSAGNQNTAVVPMPPAKAVSSAVPQPPDATTESLLERTGGIASDLRVRLMVFAGVVMGEGETVQAQTNAPRRAGLNGQLEDILDALGTCHEVVNKLDLYTGIKA